MISGVSLKTAYRANRPAMEMSFPNWFGHQEDSFIITKFTIKVVFTISCPPAGNTSETPGLWKHERYRQRGAFASYSYFSL